MSGAGRLDDDPDASDLSRGMSAAQLSSGPADALAALEKFRAASRSNGQQSDGEAGRSGDTDGGGAASLSAKLSRPVSEFGELMEEEVVSSSQVPANEVFPVVPGQVGPQHFAKLKLLGRGGIGRVYLVLLKGTKKLYAMKVLTKEEMIRRNKVKRVMTEREILATANHPFIVTMYASYQTATRLCFIMEFCEGGEFFRVLQRQPKKRLTESATRFYAAEVLLALEYLHHMGFIYRDLKPENVLMRMNGHIALTDFDLSKQAHAVSPRVIERQMTAMEKVKQSFHRGKQRGSKLNLLQIVDSEPVLAAETKSFVGTEEYIAPEVVQGVGQSSAVDWWTLGILIYEMLVGTTPFKGSDSDETFSNIVSHQVKFPDDVEVSPEGKSVIRKLLRREADKRLGHTQGASEIRSQKWFQDLNFELIRNKQAPIVPKMRDPYDLTQYKTVKDDVSLWLICVARRAGGLMVVDYAG